jgi:hypothetical protein
MTGSCNVVDNLASLVTAELSCRGGASTNDTLFYHYKLEKYGNDMEVLVYNRTANLQQRTIELEEERSRTQTLLKGMNQETPSKKDPDMLNHYDYRPQGCQGDCRSRCDSKAKLFGQHVSW